MRLSNTSIDPRCLLHGLVFSVSVSTWDASNSLGFSKGETVKAKSHKAYIFANPKFVYGRYPRSAMGRNFWRDNLKSALFTFITGNAKKTSNLDC